MEGSRSLTSFLELDAILMRKVGAEFLGTFILIFAAAAGPIVNQKYDGTETLPGNAACSGLAVMVVVFSTGHISGAHLNPSVTIAFAAFRHFPWSQVPLYITAQVSASISASFALKSVFHPFMNGGVTVPSVGNGQAFALEFIVTFILMFVIIAVATDTRAVGELAGVAIGTAVLLDILIAGPTTGASMNPARTLGPAIAAGHYKSLWIYLVAPTLGALAGAAAYTAVKLPEIPQKSPNQMTTVMVSLSLTTVMVRLHHNLAYIFPETSLITGHYDRETQTLQIIIESDNQYNQYKHYL